MPLTLAQQLLKKIESSPAPISTPDLIALHCEGLSHNRQRVWVALQHLYRAGLIQKRLTTLRAIGRDELNTRVAVWSRTEARKRVD